MKKGLGIFLGALSLAGGAFAQPFYVRGEFNSWDTSMQMNDMGGGHYYLLVSGLTPGQNYQFKAANADWSIEAPTLGGNLRTLADSNGNIGVHFYDNLTPGDGWLPDGRRAGYDDLLHHNWEIMGSFNGWSSPILTLTDLGSGQYSGTTMINAGSYDFKFRRENDWNVTIGNGFADNGGDIHIDVASDTLVRFDLDLPGGRFRYTAVPEPATFAVLGLGALAAIRRRKRSA